jgi:Holliday junction DNA helicase RuvA
MIGFLRGTLLQKLPPFLVLDVHGVGYELEAPMTTFYDLPEEREDVSLYTHLVVREDAQLLFGFSDHAQRELFRSLLKVSGVGPRVALAILSTLSTAQFIQCVQRQDTLTLTTVPGIGKKTAERMLLDLRDRVMDLGTDDDGTAVAADSPAGGHSPKEDAIGALLALGYRRQDADRAVRSAAEEADGREDLIRRALQSLSQR